LYLIEKTSSFPSNALTIVRSALEGAVEAGHLTMNPARNVKLPKGALRKTHEGWTWLSLKELAALLEAAPTPKARALWTVGAYSGLRVGELLGLRWEDVDFARDVLRVRHTRDDAPKTAKALREVSLLAPARDALLVWRELSRKIRSVKGLVWTSPRGGCHVLGYDADLVETVRAIRLGRHFTIRDLRHTCASNLLGLLTHPWVNSPVAAVDRGLRA
jgi:integrase